MKEQEKILMIKSKFNPIYETLQREWIIILLFILLIIPSIIFGTFWLIAIAIAIVAIVTAVFLFYRYEQYKAYEYIFCTDKVIFNSNFFNVENKQIKYNNIIEVKYKQSILQTMFKLGDIIINTSAENGINNGIIIYSVENVKELYKKINSIIK